MNKFSSLIIFPSTLFFFYLITLNSQAAFTFLILLISYLFFLKLALATKNNILIVGVLLAAISNVLGTPLFIINKARYTYKGWNAVGNFDFEFGR